MNNFLFAHPNLNMAGNIKYNSSVPLYEQVENDIKRKISTGVLRPGDSIGSLKELIKEYQVSAITIKRTISNLIAEKTLFTRVGKGTYVAEPQKPSVDFSSHKTIGLVLRDMKHPFFSLIVQGIEERADELGYNILLSSSSNRIEKEEKQINKFRKMGVDGLIIASLSLEYRATPLIQKLHDEKFPYIMVSYIHDPHCWYIGSDHELGGFIATEHLIKLGHKSIGYVHAGEGNLLSEVRKNGYSRALMEHDLPYDSKLIYYSDPKDTSDRYQMGYKLGKAFATLPNRPTALFIYSDLTAMGFEQAAIEERIKIPEDVSIVGYDDIFYARYSNIPLTTVHQPAEKIGKMSVDIIEKRISHEDISNRTIFKPSLVIRESCGAKYLALQNKAVNK